MKPSILENFNNRNGCKTIELPVRMFDKNFFMKNLERYYDRRIKVALRNGNPVQGRVHNSSTFRTILYEKSTEK